MEPSFNKDIDNKTKTDNKQQRKKFEHNDNTSNPYKKNKETSGQIISGYFLNEKPYRELIVQRINNFLYGLLGVLVLFCFIGYYFVSCKEVQLNQISRETLELNYENEDLQNKLDSLQSYYNIDKAVTKSNILERARHVVEVNAIDLPNFKMNSTNKDSHSLVVSY